MKTTARILPLLAFLLPGCDVVSEADHTNVFDALGVEEGDLPDLSKAELELLATEIEADTFDVEQLDEDDRLRLDELADLLDNIDTESSDALSRLGEIETELTGIFGASPRNTASGGETFKLEQTPVANNLHCHAARSVASAAQLQAFFAKYYANLSRTYYGASYSQVCWVYTSLVKTYADQGTAHAALSPSSWSARADTISSFEDLLGFADDAVYYCAVSSLYDNNTYANRAFTYSQDAEATSQTALAQAIACIPQ